jgi:hypothetical protein
MKADKLKDSRFLLFRLISPESSLRRDEPSMLTKILSMSVLLFLIVDLIIIVFYVKTNRRLETLKADNYTQVIIRSIDISSGRHADNAHKTMKTILNDKDNMRNFINDLQFFARDIERIDPAALHLPTLQEFTREATEFSMDNGKVVVSKLNKVIELFGKMEAETKQLNDLLLPIDLFDENEHQVELSEEKIYRNLDHHMQTFLNHLNHLDDVHTENQRLLADNIAKSIEKFDATFGKIYKKQRFTRVIEYRFDTFNQFDGAFLTFSEPYGNLFGTQLTRNDQFKIHGNNQLYYCVIQIFASSLNTFNVMLQFVDKGEERDDEKIIFESYKIKGGFKNPMSYNEVKVFELGRGGHNLYLRVVSTGGASQLQFSAMRFECLTFKRF